MKAITPYLNFDGNCREAMTFYQQCFGGEVHVMTVDQAPFEAAPEAKDRLIHARLVNGATVLMASDAMPGMTYEQGNSVSLNLFCDSVEEVDTVYAALSEGGKEVVAPHDAFWGARFAMLTDRFGFHWMINHERPAQG